MVENIIIWAGLYKHLFCISFLNFFFWKMGFIAYPIFIQVNIFD